MQRQALPSAADLAVDIRRVMSKGVGRPYRANVTTPHLELVAREVLPDSPLRSLGLCSAAIDWAVSTLSNSSYKEAVEAAFGISDEAKEEPELKARMVLAAKKLHGKPAVLEEKTRKAMCRQLADIMLELAIERRMSSTTLTSVDGAAPPVEEGPAMQPLVGSDLPAPRLGAPPVESWPTKRLAKIGMAAALMAVVSGLVVWLATRPTSRAVAPPAASLPQLSKEAERNLTGSQAPQPSKQMTAVLGFGDQIPRGRPTYREHKAQIIPPTTPTFDSVPNAQNGVGDERRFLHVESSLATDAEQLWQIPKAHALVANPHEIVWAIVDIDNNAEATAHCALSGKDVATGSRLRVAVWNSADDHLHVIRAWLSATNATPPWITDAVAVVTRNVTTLEPDSALSREYSKLSPRFQTNPSINVESLLLYPGLLIGGDGLVGSCWDNRYYFALGFRQT